MCLLENRKNKYLNNHIFKSDHRVLIVNVTTKGQGNKCEKKHPHIVFTVFNSLFLLITNVLLHFSCIIPNNIFTKSVSSFVKFFFNC